MISWLQNWISALLRLQGVTLRSDVINPMLQYKVQNIKQQAAPIA